MSKASHYIKTSFWPTFGSKIPGMCAHMRVTIEVLNYLVVLKQRKKNNQKTPSKKNPKLENRLIVTDQGRSL